MIAGGVASDANSLDPSQEGSSVREICPASNYSLKGAQNLYKVN